MKHIFTAGLSSEEVTIFGKGPSFQRFKARGVVYALNQSAIWLMEEGIVPDLVISNDYECIEEIGEWCKRNKVITMLACPVYPHRDKAVSVEYSLDLPFDVYHYDLWSGPKKHFAEQRFWMVETSYNSALLIADYFGAKTINTSGVDDDKYKTQFELEARLCYSGTTVRRIRS